MGPRALLLHGRDGDRAPIFTLETQLVSKTTLVEQPFRPIVTSPYHETIQDLEWSKAPPLGGYVATTIKPTAEQFLMTHQEVPLLAAWRYGLGRAVAFTADAKAKWGILWLRWRDFNKFWSQVVRWTLCTETRQDTTVTVARRDGRGLVTVDAIDAQGEFINFLDAQAGVVNPDKSQHVLELEQVAPGRYRGEFPAGAEGVYLTGLSYRQEGRLVGSAISGTVVPYAEEYRKLGVDDVLLREIAELTGGGPLGDPKDSFTVQRRRSRVPWDLWPGRRALRPGDRAAPSGPGARQLGRAEGPREERGAMRAPPADSSPPGFSPASHSRPRARS